MIGHHSHHTYMTLNNSCFRVARNHARIDAKRGDRLLLPSKGNTGNTSVAARIGSTVAASHFGGIAQTIVIEMP
jgi:hypothetical protein